MSQLLTHLDKCYKKNGTVSMDDIPDRCGEVDENGNTFVVSEDEMIPDPTVELERRLQDLENERDGLRIFALSMKLKAQKIESKSKEDKQNNEFC